MAIAQVEEDELAVVAPRLVSLEIDGAIIGPVARALFVMDGDAFHPVAIAKPGHIGSRVSLHAAIAGSASQEDRLKP